MCSQQNPGSVNSIGQMAPVHQQTNYKEKKGVEGGTCRLKDVSSSFFFNGQDCTAVLGDILVLKYKETQEITIKVRIVLMYEGERRGGWDGTNGKF